MNIINNFFGSYRVVHGPLILHLTKSMVGKIFLYSTKNNRFVEDSSCVFLFDNGEIHCDEQMIFFLNFTATQDHFAKYCQNLWNIEMSSKGIKGWDLKNEGEIISI